MQVIIVLPRWTATKFDANKQVCQSLPPLMLMGCFIIALGKLQWSHLNQRSVDTNGAGAHEAGVLLKA
jgi:hypothetical protein